MDVFTHYSRYYDLLYQDKDYKAEADCVDRMIQRFHPEGRTILDLGCGTGRHDFLLADIGYAVTGVDLSKDMLAIAMEQWNTLNNSQKTSVSFIHGDIRKMRLDQTFDVVISLFHVMSYQSQNDDLQQAFETASIHLRPQGLFIFDCWYGPAVLSDRPTPRIKTMEDDVISVVRFAEPALHVHDNIVDVHYHVVIRDRATQQAEEVNERHRMRYLFQPEVKLFLEHAGLEFVGLVDFFTMESLEPKEWNACFIARKKT